MNKYQPLRKCISHNDKELIIYGTDNFSQFPRRDATVYSKCDRALPVACRDDLVVLRGKLDIEYYNWLHSHGLGGCPRMPFSPNSALREKNYPRNISYMPAVIFFASLDFGKNCYSRTAS